MENNTLTTNHLMVVRLLLAAGAMINAENQFQHTPLMKLLHCRQKSTVINAPTTAILRELINAGAKLNSEDLFNRRTIAFDAGIDYIKILVDAGAALTSQITLTDEDTKYSLQASEYLVRHGVLPDTIKDKKYRKFYEETYLIPLLKQALLPHITESLVAAIPIELLRIITDYTTLTTDYSKEKILELGPVVN